MSTLIIFLYPYITPVLIIHASTSCCGADPFSQFELAPVAYNLSRSGPTCSGAHGLSFLITTTRGAESHSILFDAGPDTKSIARNLKALKTDTSTIERIVLSVSLSSLAVTKSTGTHRFL